MALESKLPKQKSLNLTEQELMKRDALALTTIEEVITVIKHDLTFV